MMKILWASSLLGALLALFFSYGDMSPEIYLTFWPDIPIVTRNSFFYGGVGALTFLFLVMAAAYRIIPNLPKQILFIPNRNFWFEDKYRRAALKGILHSLILGWGIVGHYFLMLTFLILGYGNHNDGTITSPSLTWLQIGYGVIGLIVLAHFRLFIPNENLLDNRER